MGFGSFFNAFGGDTSDRTANPPPNVTSGGRLGSIQNFVSGTLDSVSRFVVNTRTRPSSLQTNPNKPVVPVANQAKGISSFTVGGLSAASLLFFGVVLFGAIWLFKR